MKFLMREKQSARYLYINPKTNIVHLIMPIMSGTDIGLDNTCKAVYSLQEFFGIAGIDRQSDALSELTQYQEALAHDIKYMPKSPARTLKVERLRQINRYLDLLRSLQKEPLIQEPLKGSFPHYPKPLGHMMGQYSSNLLSIRLRPTHQDLDLLLRTTAIKSVFSLPHDVFIDGKLQINRSFFHEELMMSLSGSVFKAKSKAELISRVVSKLPEQPLDFDSLFDLVKQQLIIEVKNYVGIDCDFEQTQGTPRAPSEPVNRAFIEDKMAVDEENPPSYELYAQALIGFCVPYLAEIQVGSPFNAIDNIESFSIAVQLLLAEINHLCHEQGITIANFGSLLEKHAELRTPLLQSINKAIKESNSIEETVIEFINQNYQAFKLKAPLQPALIVAIKQGFKAHYEQIKDSPHFDEFMLLSKRKGSFFCHQGCIATSIALFLNTPEFQFGFKNYNFLQQRLTDLPLIDMPENMLPHKNSHLLEGEINIDLAVFDDQALRILYGHLNAYPDPEIKSALLAQFMFERPDFKPKTNTTNFLQCVAYGKQNEAESYLKEDAELAQELLKTHRIAFTDYVGRTFTCTAYEYAFWAKDAHMMRMLEKHMNDETKAFILNLVLEIERPENPNASPGFFANPHLVLKKNKGLNYTTKNAQGETIYHNETHFNLQPLKDALQNYSHAFNHSARLTDEDWAVLNEIWLKQVGGAQSQVPAHIAQEYCQSKRSLLRIVGDKSCLDASNPDNLIRQFEFYNLTTGSNELWFIDDSLSSQESLGSTIAVLSREGGYDSMPKPVDCELAAIKIIDEVRTNDLKQSLANLHTASQAQLSLDP